MQLRWDGNAGHLKINEIHYKLQQVHWHTPSEHTIDGKRYILIITTPFKLSGLNLFVLIRSTKVKLTNAQCDFKHIESLVVKIKETT